ARPYWLHIVGLFLLDLLSTPLSLLSPLPLKIAVDNVIGTQPLPGLLATLIPPSVAHSSRALLLLTVALLIGRAVLGQIQGLASSMLRTFTGERLVLGFRSMLFGHVQR